MPDKMAFEELVAEYQQKVFNQCYFLLGQNRQDAEDAAQEIFCNVYRNMGTFKGDSKFSTWLYSVTRNHCLNMLKQKRANRTSSEAPNAELSSSGENISQTDRHATQDCVRQKVNLLDEIHRTVIALVHFDELSYEEAAERLGCPVGTIRSRLNRAFENLRPLIRECI